MNHGNYRDSYHGKSEKKTTMVVLPWYMQTQKITMVASTKVNPNSKTTMVGSTMVNPILKTTMVGSTMVTQKSKFLPVATHPYIYIQPAKKLLQKNKNYTCLVPIFIYCTTRKQVE